MRCVSCGEPGASAHSCPSCGAGRKPASKADLDAAFSEKPPPLGGPRVGHDFGPRYHILKTVGAGGMGIVYQALDRELNVHVALKMLRGAPGGVRMAAELQRRFTTELVLARQITHKNVIRIHDIGEVNGIRFISMPFIEGDDLATPLAHGPLPLAKTLRYARHLASGLMAVHAAGVVHRDIKPANVMIGEGDQAVLMDFGIARSSAPGAAQLTAAGASPGTLAYMAPEQARGEQADQRTDIYAFGLLLREMITGTCEVSTVEILGRMKSAPPSVRESHPQVPETLDAIVTRCLQPNPSNRYQTAIELAKAISGLPRDGRGGGSIAACARRWLPRAAALAALLLLAGCAYWAIANGFVTRLAKSVMPQNLLAENAADADSDATDNNDNVGRIPRSGSAGEGGIGSIDEIHGSNDTAAESDGAGVVSSGEEIDDEGRIPRVVRDSFSEGGSGSGEATASTSDDTTPTTPESPDPSADSVPRSAGRSFTVGGPGDMQRGSEEMRRGPLRAAKEALRRGDLKDATREAESAIKANPQSPAGYQSLAAAMALTSPSSARAPYERMAATGAAGASLAAIGLADLALYEGRYSAAAQILESAIARDARTADRAGLATKYIALAEAREGEGLRAAAVTAIGEALETSRDAAVLLPAARLYIDLDRNDDARAIGRELSAGKDKESRAYGRIVDAELALDRGDTADAIETLRRLVKTTDLWLARFVLGMAYLQAKEYPEAVAELNMCEVRQGEAAALFDAEEPSIRYLGMLQYLLARAREGAGLRAEAAKDLRQFLVLRQGSPNGEAEREARVRLTRILR